MNVLILVVAVFCIVQMIHFSAVRPANYPGVPTEMVLRWRSAERTSYACLLAMIMCLTVAYQMYYTSQPTSQPTAAATNMPAIGTQSIIAGGLAVVAMLASAIRAVQAAAIRKHFRLTWSAKNFVPMTVDQKEKRLHE